MNNGINLDLAPVLGGAAVADLSPCMGCGFDHPMQGYCQECRDNGVPALSTTCKGCGGTHEVALSLQELDGLCWECYMPHECYDCGRGHRTRRGALMCCSPHGEVVSQAYAPDYTATARACGELHHGACVDACYE